MKSGLSLFKSKVAKRSFFLFFLFAMLTITIFSYLSFTHVSAQLKEHRVQLIKNTAKSYGLILYERFVFLELELDNIGSKSLFLTQENIKPKSNNSFNKRQKGHLETVSFLTSTGETLNILGEMKGLPKGLTDKIKPALKSKTQIFFESDSGINTRVFIVKKALGTDGKPGFLVGEANTVKLRGIGYENFLPPLKGASVLDHNRNLLFGSYQLPPQILQQIRFESYNLESKSLEYNSENEHFFIGYWPMFLRSKFEGPNLIVVVRNKRHDVFAPLSYFEMLFPLLATLAFLVILLLSITSIRKSMVSLEELKEGALRLANRDFNIQVDIKSGDEFEALANTFNQSAAYLGRQFHAMEAMADIDQVAHASLNTKTIVNTTLRHMYDFFSCDAISFGFINNKRPDTIRMVTCSDPKADKLLEKFLMLTTEDRNRLSEELGTFIFDTQIQSPSFLPDQIVQTVKHFMVQPLYHNKELSGIICLGHNEKHSYNKDDIAHLNRLGNQLSSALSNAHLVEELESLNWGTLEALARTVDAKSKWTAGHSERVAKLAVKIARVMGLDAKEIDTLNRAAFLHDIGKIGISLHIIDKSDKLSDEEYEQIMEHPIIGAKIIEPIKAYLDARPIILQHHERFDGKGYPYGLSGEDMVIGARILSLADAYDAIISNRPYRQGAVEENVIKAIIAESGKHFDPKVVDAFLTLKVYPV